MVDGCPNANGDAAPTDAAGAALEGAALPPKENVVPEAVGLAAAPKGLLAASPNVKVEDDEGVVVVVAPNEVAAAAAGFGCPKLKVEVEAGAAVPKEAEAVVAAAGAAALVLLALDPKENEGAPPPPKEKAGAAAEEAVAAAVVVAAAAVVCPKENDGVPVAVVAGAAAAPSFTEPKEKPPPPPVVVFPKVNAEPDVAEMAEVEVVVVAVAVDAADAPNEKLAVARVEVVFAAVVVLACPKLKGGAPGVRLEVVAWATLFELLPKENDGVVGMAGVALAVVFALSEATVEPNEKLAAGIAGAPPPGVVSPKVNAEPVVAGEAAEEVVDVDVVATDAVGVPNEKAGVADVEVVSVAVVVLAWPKLKEGAAGVRLEVVVVVAWAAFVVVLLPKEKDGEVGKVGVALAVVFAFSETAVDPNEKLVAGAAGASDLPKENPDTVVAGVSPAPLPDTGLSFSDAEVEGGAASSAFFSSPSFFPSFSSDFFSTPKLNIAAFAFSGLFPSASFSALEVLSPKENVTFGGEEATTDGALLESESEGFEAPADLSSAAVSAPSVTSFFFLPPSSSFFASSGAGVPSMTSLSSKVESKSATLFPMRLLSAS